MELPELAIGPIKAKVDTGARTSALHAVDVDVFDRDGSTWVSFAYEHEDGSVGTVNEAPVLEFRDVTNSGGQSESRPVTTKRQGLTRLPISLVWRLSMFCSMCQKPTARR